MIHLNTLDLNIVTQCNFRCISCAVAAPIAGRHQVMPPDVVAHDLAAIQPYLHFRVIHLVGGEPLLHPQLVEIIRTARASGVSDETAVLTNGSLLSNMNEEFWAALHVLQVSVYDQRSRSGIAFAEKQRERFGFILRTVPFAQFIRVLKANPDDGRTTFETCAIKRNCYTLNWGKFHMCPQSIFFPQRLQGLLEGIETDGLSLEGFSEQSFVQFMNRSEPFNACKICALPSMKWAEWQECATGENWLKVTQQRSV